MVLAAPWKTISARKSVISNINVPRTCMGTDKNERRTFRFLRTRSLSFSATYNFVSGSRIAAISGAVRSIYVKYPDTVFSIVEITFNSSSRGYSFLREILYRAYDSREFFPRVLLVRLKNYPRKRRIEEKRARTWMIASIRFRSRKEDSIASLQGIHFYARF